MRPAPSAPSKANRLAPSRLALGFLAAASLMAPAASYAADMSDAMSTHAMNADAAPMDHAATDHGAMAMPPLPASVTWAMMAPAGGFMFNYTPTFMSMGTNYIGTTKVSPETIVTTIPSGQTHTMMMMGKSVTMPTMLRIVPTSMDAQMHMFNAMYGLTKDVTLMASGGYVGKTMSMTSYSGMMGATVLGSSTGSTDGLADTMVGAAYRAYQDNIHHLQFSISFSLPTGSQTRQVQMLSPMTGMLMTMRAPYAMQSGTGTFDFVPAVAYTGMLDKWSWGLGYKARIALDNNSEGYHYGDLHEFHGWAGYSLFPWLTPTFHVIGTTQDHIQGSDALITGLSQTANPLYYGGQRVTLLGGVVMNGAPLGYRNASLAVEAGAPVYQNLNGPQLGQNWQLTLSARAMF